MQENRTPLDLDIDINMDFEENSPYQEGIISETYQMPDKLYFEETPELDSLVSTGRLVQKVLPKQTDIDKVLKILQRSFKWNTSASNSKGNTGRILDNPIFQGFIFIFGPKQIA